MTSTEDELADALRDVCEALDTILRIVRIDPSNNETLAHARELLAKYAQPLNPS